MSKKSSGSALILVLFVMLVLTILGMGLLSITTTNYLVMTAEDDYQSAYYIAESGAWTAYEEITGAVERIYDACIRKYQDDGLEEPEELQQRLKNYLYYEMDHEFKREFAFNFRTQSFTPNSRLPQECFDDNRASSQVQFSLKDTGPNSIAIHIQSLGQIGDNKRRVDIDVEVYKIYKGANGPLSAPAPDGMAVSTDFWSYALAAQGSLSVEGETGVVRGDVYGGEVADLVEGVRVFGDIYIGVPLEEQEEDALPEYPTAILDFPGFRASVTGLANINAAVGSSRKLSLYQDGAPFRYVEQGAYTVRIMDDGPTDYCGVLYTPGDVEIEFHHEDSTFSGLIVAGGDIRWNRCGEVNANGPLVMQMIMGTLPGELVSEVEEQQPLIKITRVEEAYVYQ